MWFPMDYATLAGLVSSFVVENELQERREDEDSRTDRHGDRHSNNDAPDDDRKY